MRHPRLFAPWLTGALLLSFTLGLGFPEVLAGASHRQLGQGGLPERAARARVPADSQGQLEPLNTFYQTFSDLKERFAGKLPGDNQLVHAAIRGLLRRVDDPYTRFLDPAQYRDMQEKNHGEYEGIGALLSPNPTPDGYLRIHDAPRGSQAAKAGLKAQDVVLAVNGVSARNKNVDQLASLIRGRSGTSVRLTVRRSGVRKPVKLTVVRRPVEVETVVSRMLAGGVGLIELEEFSDRSDAQVDRALTQLERQGMRALILDLRGNGGGTLDAAQEIASRFLPPGKTIVRIVERTGEPEIRQVIDSRRNHWFNRPGRRLPLMVLVNGTSASASEIVAGAIQDHRTGVILGTTTYGKGLVQTVVPLRGGAAVVITSARYLTPSGRDINRGRDRRGGITPDVLVEATEEDWIRQNDVQLKKALALLQQKLGPAPRPTARSARTRRSVAPPARTSRRPPRSGLRWV